ncbi:SWI/SNF complex subunit SWI3C homolog isoform X2 [Phragmites australis]|uniref:SWI/SNF complex subunit SWI3C homolog isoform X2 n=1 Tax=Phragmites australis TaxID=29695 RepID=UPI002D78C9DB|nr:SWI/SNF complex subunit SWI3C homolog isoform X2 [Phragmites australis]
MPRKASSSADARSNWRKRKRTANPSPSKQPADHSDDSDSAAATNGFGGGDDDAPHAASANGGGGTLAAAAAGDDDTVLDLREAEVFSSAEPVSGFPAAVRRAVGRPHPSVLAVVAAERAAAGASGAPSTPAPSPALENISHGQLQVRSAMLPDHPSLSDDPDKPSTYVCTPHPLMEGRGVPKQFYGKLHIVPRHSDWFIPTTVHRLERQVVPQYFSGKSQGHTPEKYMMLRNKVIAKYLERPEKRLVFAECQGLVTSTAELYDLSRILRFLESWGIINYLAAGSAHRGLRMAASLIKEETTGELQLVSAPMKSIDGLILFDRPKCSIRAEDIASVVSTSSAPVVANGDAAADLDEKIWEHLSESSCSFCSKPLTDLHYESQKEANIFLCSDCFHNARFVPGHSSLDFQRMDGTKDGSDTDGDRWTDQETLLLLEGIEKFNDNWNHIAEHVGTKSKAQCIHHFIRLPVEDGWLENIEVPEASLPFRMQSNGFLHSDSNGSTSGCFPQSSQPRNQIPFINSANPVMSLVAFLASKVGPRVAASCASAALSVLTRDDSRMCSEGIDAIGHAAHRNYEIIVKHNQSSSETEPSSSISHEAVKNAAMCGLSAAATKSKLFADQEEREIQRLAATIINHQLKRLELKLKQFAEVETMLLKESERLEGMRQQLAAQRARMLSARFASTGGTLPGGSSTMASNPMNQVTSPRPPLMPSSMPQSSMPALYTNNMQGHPQMALLQQQRQQMLSFGPRLPLSAIHPGSSSSAPNIMFNPGMPNPASPNHHPLLRPPSGNNSNVG